MWLDSLVLPLFQRAAKSVVKSAFRTCEIAGPRWHGLVIPETLVQLPIIAGTIDQILACVTECINEDLLVRLNHSRLFIIYTLDAGKVNEIAECIIGKDNDELLEDATGRYIRRINSTIISGLPGSPLMVATCAHEICHALCNTTFPNSINLPWCFEGYAHYVEASVCRRLVRYDGNNILTECLVTGRSMHPETCLRDILLFGGNYAELRNSNVIYFHAVAGLFVQYLALLAKSSKVINKVFQAAVRGSPPTCEHHLHAIERAIGRSIEEIEETFHKWTHEMYNSRVLMH